MYLSNVFVCRFITSCFLFFWQLRDLRKDNSRLETDLEDKEKVPGLCLLNFIKKLIK